jgi:uncharacterized membrane protein YdjX (TVP38/TMEM64 family)
MMLRRLVPLIILVAGLSLVFLTGAYRYMTFDALRDNREVLVSLVAENQLLALALFMAVYVAAVATSAPGGAVLTLAGGFLFGTWLGGAVTIVAATLGATILFVAARFAFGDSLRRRFGSSLARFEDGFKRDAFSYLLVLRLVPLFPFFLVNLAPALLGVNLRVYVITTFLGIMPATFVFAGIGNGLGAVFDAGQVPDLRIILKLEILGPLLGLAALSLIPVIYRRWKGSVTA